MLRMGKQKAKGCGADALGGENCGSKSTRVGRQKQKAQRSRRLAGSLGRERHVWRAKPGMAAGG